MKTLKLKVTLMIYCDRSRSVFKSRKIMKNIGKCKEAFVLWWGEASERGAPQVLQGYLLPLMNTSAVLLLCWQVGCAAFLLHNGFNCAL